MSEFWHGRDGSVWVTKADRDLHNKLTRPQSCVNDLVELTDYGTGGKVRVRPSKCDVIRDLPSRRGDSILLALSRRTRIDMGSDCVLVQETYEEVMELLFPTPIVDAKTRKAVTFCPVSGGPFYQSAAALESALARILAKVARRESCDYSDLQTIRRYCREGLSVAWACKPSDVGIPDLSKLSM